MANPSNLRYSKDHEWVKIEGDVATVGITDYAQNALGDIVFVELPRKGQTFQQHATVGVVESVKSVSDLFTPVGGEVLEVNDALTADAALVNREPYTGGWMLKIKLDGAGGHDTLMDAAEYEKLTAEG